MADKIRPIFNSPQVYSWGVNDNKALGRTGPEDIPAKILGLEGISVARIAAGDSISIAISEDGRLYMWGSFRVSFCRHHIARSPGQE